MKLGGATGAATAPSGPSSYSAAPVSGSGAGLGAGLGRGFAVTPPSESAGSGGAAIVSRWRTVGAGAAVWLALCSSSTGVSVGTVTGVTGGDSTPGAAGAAGAASPRIAALATKIPASRRIIPSRP
jgi:hypothetical protein